MLLVVLNFVCAFFCVASATHDLQRQKMESELTHLRSEFAELQTKHETMSASLMKHKSEKLALVKAVKQLRNEREENHKLYKNEISSLRLSSLTEVSNLKNKYENKLIKYKTDIREYKKILEDVNIAYKSQINTLHRSLGDIIDKLNTFTKTLDNASLTQFRDNSPNTSDFERIRISNNILEGLVGMIESALKEADTKHQRRQTLVKKRTTNLFQDDDDLDQNENEQDNDDNSSNMSNIMNSSLNSSSTKEETKGKDRKDSKESKESKDSKDVRLATDDGSSGDEMGSKTKIYSPRVNNKYELSVWEFVSLVLLLFWSGLKVIRFFFCFVFVSIAKATI